MKFLFNIAYYTLIIFFSYTVSNKIISINSFQENIFKTGIFSKTIVDIISYTVIILEIIMVLLLIMRKKVGLIYSLFMMVIFTVYICYLFYTGRYEVCGCGGILNGLSFKVHFLINILIIFCILNILAQKNESK